MHLIDGIIYAFDSAHGRFNANQIRRIQLFQTSNLPCVESNNLIRPGTAETISKWYRAKTSGQDKN